MYIYIYYIYIILYISIATSTNLSADIYVEISDRNKPPICSTEAFIYIFLLVIKFVCSDTYIQKRYLRHKGRKHEKICKTVSVILKLKFSTD